MDLQNVLRPLQGSPKSSKRKVGGKARAVVSARLGSSGRVASWRVPNVPNRAMEDWKHLSDGTESFRPKWSEMEDAAVAGQEQQRKSQGQLLIIYILGIDLSISWRIFKKAYSNYMYNSYNLT